MPAHTTHSHRKNAARDPAIIMLKNIQPTFFATSLEPIKSTIIALKKVFARTPRMIANTAT